MPVVSVIMPIFNTVATYLKEAIDSVMAQSMTDWELLIVDNGSTEQATLICLKSYNDQRIRLFHLAENIGPARARNYAMERSQGKYLAFLDSDDVWEANKLAEQIRVLEGEQAIGCVATVARCLGDPGAPKFKYYPTSSSIELNLLLGLNPLCTSSVMLRKSVLDQLQLKEEPEFSPAEDYRLWTRLLFECGFAMVGQTLTSYRWYQSNTSHQQMDSQRECLLKSQYDALKKFVGVENLTSEAWQVYLSGKVVNAQVLATFLRFMELLIKKLSVHGYVNDEVEPILRHRIRNLFYHTKGFKAQLSLFRSPLSNYFRLPLWWKLFCLITRGVI